MQQPPLIVYNLKDRGRQHRGQERNFDIKAICDSINGPATQERIRTRAMLGYYGHRARLLAGMEPSESFVAAGKYNEVEPAIVTTFLEASLDGTIKHQTEFLDSVSGRKAARMYENRIGGFSSAIDERRPELFGFDYVLDPNYSTNRGFSLDSCGLTFDQVLEEVAQEEESFWLKLISDKDALIAELQASLDSASKESEQYLAMLASGNYKQPEQIALDDIVVSAASLTMSTHGTEQLMRDVDNFRSASLKIGDSELVKSSQADRNYQKLKRRLGF